MKVWPHVVAVLMLSSAWVSIESLSHGDEIRVVKKPFAEFPLNVAGRWQGKELTLDEKVLKVLRLSDYLMRVYVPVDEEKGLADAEQDSAHRSMAHQPGHEPLWLYVGFYQSQRTGATYHSPKNCLPGAGWQFVRSEYVKVPLPGTSGVTINKVLIQKGLDRQMILYWYQDRGRIIASEYWAKGYLIWDAMTKNRTDGSLVRISIPVVHSPHEAYQEGLRFLQDLWPALLDSMPDHSIQSL